MVLVFVEISRQRKHPLHGADTYHYNRQRQVNENFPGCITDVEVGKLAWVAHNTWWGVKQAKKSNILVAWHPRLV